MNIRRRTTGNERGSAVVVILILLFLMVAFSMANSRALSNLKKEMQVMEKDQIKRIESVATEQVSTPAQTK